MTILDTMLTAAAAIATVYGATLTGLAAHLHDWRNTVYAGLGTAATAAVLVYLATAGVPA